MKKISKNQFKKVMIASSSVLAAVALIVLGSVFLIHARGDGVDGIAAEVTVGQKTYTADNKLKILEILPHEAFDELGCIVGDDQGTLPWNEIVAACPKGQSNQGAISNFINDYINTYNDFCTQIVGGQSGYKLCYKNELTGDIYDQPWTINLAAIKYDLENLKLTLCKLDQTNWRYTEVEGGIRNYFGYAVFGHKHMEDKVEVIAKTASEVTVADIESASLVYVSGQTHNGQLVNLYNRFYNLNGTPNQVNTWPHWELGVSDMQAEVAFALYMKNITEAKAFMFNSTDKSAYNNVYPNVARITTLQCAIDNNTFIMDFAYDKISDTHYRGNAGEVRIETENGNRVINIYLYTEGGTKKLPFSSTMFINDTAIEGKYGYAPNGNNVSYYPAYNATESNKQSFLGIATYEINGNNALTNEFSSFDATQSDYDANGNYLGSSYGDALLRFDLANDGLLSPRVIEYILGATADIFIPEGEKLDIRVLEIEPAGVYRYYDDNLEDVNKILGWFGFTKAQYKDKITVSIDHLPLNGFNGLNSDIRSDYDLVILGAYDINKDNENQHEMADSSAYTNMNDLTEKAYNKLVDYARIGMPLIVDRPIFYGDQTVLSNDTKVSKFNTTDLTREIVSKNGYVTNIVAIDISGSEQKPIRTLKYRIKPQVDVMPLGAPNYDASNPVLVTKSQLSKMQFGGTITNKGKYRVRIFVDRNCDSIFSEEYDSDKAELLYFASANNRPVTDSDGRILGAEHEGSEFLQTLPLPEALNGYIGWKVEVVDVETGVIKNAMGAFAVQNDVVGKTVKVLQLVTDDPVGSNKGKDSNIDLKGDTFTNCFNATTKVTGLGLDVTVLKKSEFNALPNQSEYLAAYSMLVLGLSDNYGVYVGNVEKDGRTVYGDFTDVSIAAIRDYIDNGNSVLFTHDSMSYRKEDSKEATSYSELTPFTKVFQTKIGMQKGFNLTDSLRTKLGKNLYTFEIGSEEEKKVGEAIENALTAVGNAKTLLDVVRNNSGGAFKDGYKASNPPVKQTCQAALDEVIKALDEVTKTLDVVNPMIRNISDLNEEKREAVKTHSDAIKPYIDAVKTAGIQFKAAQAGSTQYKTAYEAVRKALNDMREQIKDNKKGIYKALNDVKDVVGPKTLKTAPYFSITNKLSSTRSTDRVTKLNTGEITEYPYKINGMKTSGTVDTISVATTHGQYFKLDLEDLKDLTGKDLDDVVVWYTLAESKNEELSDYFKAAGQDAVNNYYVYSMGNITYSSAGHSEINQNNEEMELFVNTFVRAIMSGNSIPEVTYEDAVQESVNVYSKYYRTKLEADTSIPLNFTYSVTDPDLVNALGRLQQVYMFYDRNNNDRYDDSDIIIAYMSYVDDTADNKIVRYTKTPPSGKSLFSAVPVTCNLWDVTRGNVSSAIEAEMANRLAENDLRIGIVAVDGSNAKGFAVLKFVERELYKLD